MNMQNFRDYTYNSVCKIVPEIKNFEKFFNKVVNKIEFLENECWLWKGFSYPKKNNHLIPSITIQYKIYPIYRVLYHFLIQPLTKIDYLIKICNNKKCVNPNHRRITNNYYDIGQSGGKLSRKKIFKCKNGHVYDETIPTFRYRTDGNRISRRCLICVNNYKNKHKIK